jgi:hypothetical protein
VGTALHPKRRMVGLVLVLLSLAAAASEGTESAQQGYTVDEMLRLGERMYRQGILPDGTPMQAVVAGDVPVDGRMFTCVNCHRRSGLGSQEGPVIAWPVNGKELSVPRRRAGTWNPKKQHKGPGAVERWSLPERFQMEDLRPPYTDETLAHSTTKRWRSSFAT